MGVRVSSFRGPSTARPRTFQVDPVSSSVKAPESGRKVRVRSPSRRSKTPVAPTSRELAMRPPSRAEAVPGRVEDHDRRPPDIVVDDGDLFQPQEGVGDGLTVELDGGDALHGAEASVLGAVEEEGGGVNVVVAGVGVAAVLAGEARVPGEHLAFGVVVPEVGPGNDGSGDLGEPGAGELSDDGLAEDLLPPAVGGAVVHDEVAVAEEAADTEGVDSVPHAAVEGDGGVAEGAESDEDRLAAYHVVDDLVPGHYLEGVGTGVAVDFDGDDGLHFGEPVDVIGDWGEPGVVDGGYSVADLAEEDFGVVDGVLGEVGAPGVSSRRVGAGEIGCGSKSGVGTGVGNRSPQGRGGQEVGLGQGCSGASGVGSASVWPVGGDHSDSPGRWVGEGSLSPWASPVEGEGVGVESAPQAAMTTRVAIRRMVMGRRSLGFGMVLGWL